MSLREILQQLAETDNPVLFDHNKTKSQASDFLSSLSERKLKTQAFLQPGLYIAEISDGGYLGTVLFRF